MNIKSAAPECASLLLSPAPRAPGPAGLPAVHFLLLLAQAVDAQAHLVAGLEELRRGLDAHADARRRARAHHVAGRKRAHVRKIRHQLLHAEDHRAGVPGLLALAIDVQPHGEILRILDLIRGHEPGPERRKGIETLALPPLAAMLELPFAFGNF